MVDIISKLKQKRIPNVLNLETVDTWNEAIDTAIEMIKQENMMKNGLDENGVKYCPFCGNEITPIIEKDFSISCDKCKYVIKYDVTSKEELISNWNKRS